MDFPRGAEGPGRFDPYLCPKEPRFGMQERASICAISPIARSMGDGNITTAAMRRR